MADKSAFVPVEALQDRRDDVDVDLDEMLFGKKSDSKMADKSAFVPVEAVTDRKGSAEVEADIDAELFGKKVRYLLPKKRY
ncbi:hypothetical protein ANCDUO_09325 [Ancylostoma duodenale]|uniref:Uncharacterized protein n=1 Tax=Ancylostoma duodenale TaxID=51022 RepID=A0A0C2GGY2_9BILA|nr:hypothetical protein ANCDUO_09325 [Ancylostoma duodenale]